VIEGGGASAINSVGVEAVPKERLPLLLANPSTTRTEVHSTGEFTLPGLVEDIPYVLSIYSLPADAYVSDLRQGGLSVFNNGATIRSNGSDGPVEVHVALRGGTVQGIVRNTLSQSVPASVVLVPSAPRRDNALLYREARTDESGRFAIRGVAPGEYKVFAWPESPRGRAYLNERFLADYESRGTTVRVNAAMTSEVQATELPLLR
jgi:hypothetical protein